MREDESVRLFAYFRDASGLSPRSRVQIAGIPVGEIGEIKLEGTPGEGDAAHPHATWACARTPALTKRSRVAAGRLHARPHRRAPKRAG